MKINKKILIALPLLVVSLASCSETKWSWWETQNIDITKGILLKDAQDAITSSSMRFDKATSKKDGYSYNTYLKNYLGQFATEWDKNVNVSNVITSKKYDNNVVIVNNAYTREDLYPNARQYVNSNIDTYSVGLSNNDIDVKTFTDNGYGEKIGSEKVIIYTNANTFKSNLSIGSTMDVSKINWFHATYGMADNGSIIVEETYVEQSSISVYMTGQSNIVTTKNTYKKYRFAKGEENGLVVWTMDYAYEKMEIKIANDVFNVAMSSPFLLEKSERVITFGFASNGTYDTSLVPVIE